MKSYNIFEENYLMVFILIVNKQSNILDLNIYQFSHALSFSVSPTNSFLVPFPVRLPSGYCSIFYFFLSEVFSIYQHLFTYSASFSFMLLFSDSVHKTMPIMFIVLGFILFLSKRLYSNLISLFSRKAKLFWAHHSST